MIENAKSTQSYVRLKQFNNFLYNLGVNSRLVFACGGKRQCLFYVTMIFIRKDSHKYQAVTMCCQFITKPFIFYIFYKKRPTYYIYLVDVYCTMNLVISSWVAAIWLICFPPIYQFLSKYWLGPKIESFYGDV